MKSKDITKDSIGILLEDYLQEDDPAKTLEVAFSASFRN